MRLPSNRLTWLTCMFLLCSIYFMVFAIATFPSDCFPHSCKPSPVIGCNIHNLKFHPLHEQIQHWTWSNHVFLAVYSIFGRTFWILFSLRRPSCTSRWIACFNTISTQHCACLARFDLPRFGLSLEQIHGWNGGKTARFRVSRWFTSNMETGSNIFWRRSSKTNWSNKFSKFPWHNLISSSENVGVNRNSPQFQWMILMFPIF